MKDETQIDSVNDTTSSESESVKLSAGQILANARNAQGLSLEELAEQIRVPVKVLVAIEADDIPDNLPETFIRGYIRSYAKKVNIDETSVLTQVETTAPSSPNAMKMQSFSKRSKRKKIERRLTIITWLIVIILAVALVFWWYQTKGIEMLAPANTVDEVSANENVPKAAIQSNDVNADIDLPANDVEETETGEAIQPAVNNTAADTADSFPASALRVQQPKEEPAEQLQNNATQGVQTTAESVAKVEQVEDNQSVAETQQNQMSQPAQSPVVLSDAEKRLLAENGESDEDDYIKVQFKFEQEVWVEVYDAFDERIAVGNKPAGYLMTLNAQGPFRVLLGSTYGVTIWVNDKEYDISDKPTNRVARFEIEAQQ